MVNFWWSSVIHKPFTNYVDKILTFFDHLPSCVDIFYRTNVDKKWTFLDHIPTLSCKRSLWKTLTSFSSIIAGLKKVANNWSCRKPNLKQLLYTKARQLSSLHGLMCPEQMFVAKKICWCTHFCTRNLAHLVWPHV